jgi:macrolide-specific efflux system membrane fusion protein
MTTQVFFVASSAKDALLVPASAVKSDDRDKTKGVVYIQTGDKKFEPKEVDLGVNNRVQVQILSGLAEGDTVVTNYRSLTDGSTPSNRPLNTQGVPSQLMRR